MEIHPYLNLGPVGRAVPTKQSGPPAKANSSDAVQLGKTAELEQALENLPDVRAEAVQRGKALVNDANYPPPETIRKISHLLALKLQEPEE